MKRLYDWLVPDASVQLRISALESLKRYNMAMHRRNTWAREVW